MRRFLEPLLITLGIIIAHWLLTGWVRVWPIGSSSLHPVVLYLIAIALFRSWPMAMWAAIVAGLLAAQYSVWPWFIYPVAMLLSIGVLRLMTQRWVAAKSTASLVMAVSAATVAFYLGLGGQVEIVRLFSNDILSIRWTELLPMMVIQGIIHPIIMYGVWRSITGGSFARAVSSGPGQQPF